MAVQANENRASPHFPAEFFYPDDRPAMPYIVGLKINLHHHRPPPPIGHPYSNRPTRRKECCRIRNQLKFCVSNPPLHGSTSLHAPYLIEITRQIAVGENRGAQIVVVNNCLVAKIYDPLYYFWDRSSFSKPQDVVFQADRDYTREAAAYDELDHKFGGKIIPKYHGSWTFDIATETPSGTQMRPVRLILMELLEGTSMYHMDPSRLTDELRLNIVADAIEAEIAIAFHGGVLHSDFEARNIMVCSSPNPGSKKPRVVVIDFNASVIRRLLPYPLTRPFSTLPYSPINRYWDRLCRFQPHWITSIESGNKWLLKRWYGSPNYSPVELEELGLSEEEFAKLIKEIDEPSQPGSTGDR